MSTEKCHCLLCQLNAVREQLSNPLLRKQPGPALAMQHDDLLAKLLTDTLENHPNIHPALLSAAKSGRLGFIDPQIEEAWAKVVIEKLDGNVPSNLEQLMEILENAFSTAQSEEPTEDPLPEWADAKAPEGKLVHGQQLYTLDGAKTGNGTLVDLYLDLKQGTPVFVVITDAGNLMRLNQNELITRFYAGQFVLSNLPTAEARKTWAEYKEAMYS